MTRTDENGFVRRPQPGDALGSALRSVYSNEQVLPADMVRLLRTLDGPIRAN